MASDNAEFGVSIVQTAEGDLNETHRILQRLNELEVQGANDTNESIDREAINEELDALTKEIDRIACSTQFNKQNLLDGSFTGKKLQVGANTNQYIAIDITAMNASGIGLHCAATVKYDTNVYSLDGTTYKTQASAEAKQAADITAALSWNSTTGRAYVNTGTNKYNISAGAVFGGGTPVAYDTQQSAENAILSLAKGSVADYKLSHAVNATVSTLSATVTQPTVSDYEKAQATLSNIQTAINQISSQRSALGALQNRLEHTIANLDNISENTQAAESRIRDTDMADEMVEYSKNNILAQAGQSMLAQSNQSTQGVLSLLQ
jgi:flagellin